MKKHFKKLEYFRKTLTYHWRKNIIGFLGIFGTFPKADLPNQCNSASSFIIRVNSDSVVESIENSIPIIHWIDELQTAKSKYSILSS